jgi:hypothetical protein
MDTFEALLNRRSIREYTQQAVPDEMVQNLLKAASMPPLPETVSPGTSLSFVTDPRWMPFPTFIQMPPWSSKLNLPS